MASCLLCKVDTCNGEAINLGLEVGEGIVVVSQYSFANQTLQMANEVCLMACAML